MQLSGLTSRQRLSETREADRRRVVRGLASQRQGESPIDNTTLVNVLRPEEATALLAGCIVRRFLLTCLQQRQRGWLRRVEELCGSTASKLPPTQLAPMLRSLRADDLRHVGIDAAQLSRRCLVERGALSASHGLVVHAALGRPARHHCPARSALESPREPPQGRDRRSHVDVLPPLGLCRRPCHTLEHPRGLGGLRRSALQVFAAASSSTALGRGAAIGRGVWRRVRRLRRLRSLLARAPRPLLRRHARAPHARPRRGHLRGAHCHRPPVEPRKLHPRQAFRPSVDACGAATQRERHHCAPRRHA